MIAAAIRLETSEFERAERFYSAIAEELEYERLAPAGCFLGWKISDNLFLQLNYSRKDDEANRDNSVTICLFTQGPEQVDRVYARAMELGATELDEPHTPDAFYKTTFRDPDGRRIEIAWGI